MVFFFNSLARALTSPHRAASCKADMPHWPCGRERAKEKREEREREGRTQNTGTKITVFCDIT